MTDQLSYLNSLKDKNLVKDGILIAEGREVCLRLFASGIKVLDVLCTAKLASELSDRLPKGIRIHEMTEARISEVLGFKFHRGILASAEIPARLSLGEGLIHCSASGQSTGPQASHGEKPCRMLVCPHISDPENLGSLYRSASALGWDGIVIGPGTVSPFSRRVVRVSMGSVFLLKTFHIHGPEELDALKKRGFLIAGTSISPGCEEISALAENLASLEQIENRSQALALMFGHEYQGLEDHWLGLCDRLVHIPMSQGPDSLNVAMTAGICCYLLGRRR